MSHLAYAVSFGVALALSLIFTPCVRWLAETLGCVAQPSQDRWSQRPIALMGGIAIFAAFAFSVLVTRPLNSDTRVLALSATSAILFALGLIDDIHSLKPQTKLVVQMIAAAILVNFGCVLTATPMAAVNVLLTIFWLVGISNAFNLLDNMDGLSAGIAFIAAGFCAAMFVVAGNHILAQAALTFAGAVLGFLFYNFNPAAIFMGDSGSLFIGFFLGGLTGFHDGVGQPSHLVYVLVIPILILLIPIFDTTFVTVVRKLSGRAVSRGGRDHTSHRLVRAGLSERHAVCTLYGLALASGGIGFFALTSHVAAVIMMTLLLVTLVLLGIYLGRVRVECPDEAPPLLQRITHKRRMFEVVLDLILITLAYFGAYALRFEGPVIGAEMERFAFSLPIIIACQLTAFALCGVYRGLWRYTSLDDLLNFIKAVTGGAILSVLAILFTFRFENYSRSVFIIDWLLLLVFVSGSRLSFRLLDRLIRRPAAGRRPVLIYGAGDAGVFAVREMQNNDALGLDPIGFVDDDPMKQKSYIHGLPVLGTGADVPRLLREHNVSEVLVSSRSVNGSHYEELVEHCTPLQIKVRRLTLTFTP